MARKKAGKPSPSPSVPAGDGTDDHVARTVASWPAIDPIVEGIVVRIDRADRLLLQAAIQTLGRLGLNHGEFKVLVRLHGGPVTHGSLSRDLLVSTGAMTNRLDKLEAGGLVRRLRDPHDRRGVLIELTTEGRSRLDEYIAVQADRENRLLGGLDSGEQAQLNRLLRKLLRSLEAEVGPPPRTKRRAVGPPS